MSVALVGHVLIREDADVTEAGRRTTPDVYVGYVHLAGNCPLPSSTTSRTASPTGT